MRQVRILDSPVTERIVHKDSVGVIDKSGTHIRVDDCWFDFDARWKVEDIKEEPQQSIHGEEQRTQKTHLRGIGGSS